MALCSATHSKSPYVQRPYLLLYVSYILIRRKKRTYLLARGDIENNDNVKPINMNELKKSKGIEKAISDKVIRKCFSEVIPEPE